MHWGAGGLARRLNGRQQQGDQHRDDGDDDQQLDQRKRRAESRGLVSFVETRVVSVSLNKQGDCRISSPDLCEMPMKLRRRSSPTTPGAEAWLLAVVALGLPLADLAESIRRLGAAAPGSYRNICLHRPCECLIGRPPELRGKARWVTGRCCIHRNITPVHSNLRIIGSAEAADRPQAQQVAGARVLAIPTHSKGCSRCSGPPHWSLHSSPRVLAAPWPQGQHVVLILDPRPPCAPTCSTTPGRPCP